MSYRQLLKNLGYSNWNIDTTKEAKFENNVNIEQHSDFNFTITSFNNKWFIESKIVLTEKDLKSIASIASRFAPNNSTISLQPDTHGAGNIYVGMIMSFEDTKIPINFVSGDIGCGLTVLPISKTPLETEEYFSYVLACIRKSIKRGKVAEQGLSNNEFLSEAIEFYNNIELTSWLDELKYIFDILGIDIKNNDNKINGLTDVQSQTLQYVGKFAQSLGSSGNHFMEMSKDEQNKYWLVIHSGSRGLGAIVYNIIADACRCVNDGFEIATNQLSSFYIRVYDALNKFAKLNRVICGIAVLKELGFEYKSNELKNIMKQSYLFAPAIEKCLNNEESILSLISGLTHNGLKAFTNDETKQVLYILSKGAVAMSKRSSASIVALRAGEGCYVWTLADISCNWKEEDLQTAIKKNYTVVYKCDGIIYSGHGAGRSQSTTATAKMSTFEDVVNFYDEYKIIGNIAPGILGDNPRIAYNDVNTIIKQLPLDIACTRSLLKTVVTFKEGITYQKEYIKKCADYITKNWNEYVNHRKLWLDINVCSLMLKEEDFLKFTKEREEIMIQYKQQFQ